MAGSDRAGREPPRSGSYFYLSYAHSAPLARRDPVQRDRWVRRFFGDLTAAVAGHATGRPSAWGFYDQQISLGSDWKVALLNGLGTTQVLVPLYSPDYFNRSFPGREWECFLERMRLAGVVEPLTRVVPVLQAPSHTEPRPAGDRPGDGDPFRYRAALRIGASEPEYARSGLRGLWQTGHHTAYQAIVDRVAAHVVEIAESSPVGPSQPPDIDEIVSPFQGDSARVFTIHVAAPAAASATGPRRPDRYGARSVDWRPFPQEQESPLVEYVVRVAEPLGFSARVTGTEPPWRKHDRPGVVLIDPWMVADEGGRDRLHDMFRATTKAAAPKSLPWVLPLVVLDAHDDDRVVRLLDVVDRILGEHGMSVHRTTRSLKDFVDGLPSVIAEAERRYLGRRRSARPAGRASDRPRLLHPDDLPGTPSPEGDT